MPLTGTHKIVHVVKRSVTKHFKTLLTVCLVFLLILHLPKPKWLCCSEQDSDSYGHQIDLSFHELSRKLKVRETSPRLGPSEKRKLEQKANIMRMFPIYSENRAPNPANPSSAYIPRDSVARIKVFTLRNYNFENFNRFWEDKASSLEQLRHKREGKELPYDPGVILDNMERSHVLPECITLRFRRPLQPPTKVCVHSRKEDNVISNQLRDFGHWEPDLLDQMHTFFEHNPSGQLVDLGCNIGVYSLLAARLGRPVLAVDALPANLALLQLAVLTNDRAATDQVTEDDVEDLLKSLRETRKARSRSRIMPSSHNGSIQTQPALFSELITSLHNAVYSRRVRMFVDITDDPNLGGMEVKELPSSQGTDAQLKQSSAHARALDTAQKSQSLIPPQPEAASHRVLVDAICLDDLVPYLSQNLSVFLKMDIEGAEAAVLRCADHFFSALDVRVVQMEILLQRYSGRMGEMTEFFQRHNLWPSEDVSGQSMLGPEPSLWPDNIYWIKVR